MPLTSDHHFARVAIERRVVGLKKEVSRFLDFVGHTHPRRVGEVEPAEPVEDDVDAGGEDSELALADPNGVVDDP